MELQSWNVYRPIFRLLGETCAASFGGAGLSNLSRFRAQWPTGRGHPTAAMEGGTALLPLRAALAGMMWFPRPGNYSGFACPRSNDTVLGSVPKTPDRCPEFVAASLSVFQLHN